MRKGLILDFLAGVYFVALAVVAMLFGLSQDHLLFESEAASLIQFFLAVSFIASLPLALAALIAALAIQRRITPDLPRTVMAIGFGVTTFGFLVFLVESLTVIGGLDGILIVSVALSPAAILAVYAARTGRLSLDAFRNVVRGVAAVGCAAVLWNQASRVARRVEASLDRRTPVNTLMIVLDGLSPDDLSTWNPDLETPDFEAIASRSRLFEQARTNYADTLGFFGIFYSGSKRGDASGSSLLRLLDQHGVNARWISFHNNGIPRGAVNQIGLRGGFLTQHAARWIDALGLDYNIFWYQRPGYRGKAISVRESGLTEWANARSREKSLLREVVPEEVERLRRDGRGFFLLVHTDYTGMTDTAPGLWEFGGDAGNDRAIAEMRSLDYTYLPRHEPLLAELRLERDARIRSGLRELRAFFEQFESRGWDRDTLLIVTADHGSLRFKRGRAWYAFHHDEEVSRVPLLLAGLGLEGKDRELRQTVDLTQTVLERHGIDARLSPDAVSLLKDPPAERIVTTMTRASHLRRERFLSVYQGRTKYLVNPWNLTARKFEIDGFELVPLDDGVIEARELPFDAAEVVREYNYQAAAPGEPRPDEAANVLSSPR